MHTLSHIHMPTHTQRLYKHIHAYICADTNTYAYFNIHTQVLKHTRRRTHMYTPSDASEYFHTYAHLNAQMQAYKNTSMQVIN